MLWERYVLPLILFLGIVLGALLVHRFAPRQRHTIGRLVVLFCVLGGLLGLHWLLVSMGEESWAPRVELLARLVEYFTIIQLLALYLLDLGLRLLRFELPRIVGDLLVGVAYFITTLSILREAGVELGTVLAGGAIVSAVLALSLQPTLGNLLGGMALQLDGSIHVGDWIALENGKQGRVKDIRWRHTLIETRDYSVLVVPNATLLGSTITILGRRDGGPVPYRMWVYFQVDFRFAPSRVCEVVDEALGRSPIQRVAATPAPQCICFDFARDGRDSFALYAVRYWLEDLAHDDSTSSVVRARIWAGLKRAGIPFARPARTLFLNEERGYQVQKEERHQADRLRALERVDLFHPLTDEERRQLEPHLVRVPYVAGEHITRQGAIAHWLYILLEGEVEVRLRVEGGESRTVARMKAPDFFGEMGLMTGEPRLADVVAQTDVMCFRLAKEDFQGIMTSRPELAEILSQHLARRRVDLIAVRDGLDEEARKRRETHEASRILSRIRDFFGLGL